MAWIYFGLLSVIGVLVSVQRTEAWFEYCDRDIRLKIGSSMYVNSTRYPNRYPSGSSCRYVITAPLDHDINVQCNINMDKGAKGCNTEFFYIITEGDDELTNAEHFCGKRYVHRRSTFRNVTIAYTSAGGRNSGIFSCLVQSFQQECDCGWSSSARIVGGQETQINEYPFMAAIVHMPTQRVICGGTIISRRHVMTAAHCCANYKNASQLCVVVGEHNLRTRVETPYTRYYPVRLVRYHEAFNYNTKLNDIALVNTQGSMEWSRGVGPACLPFLYSFAPFDDCQVEIAGWGTKTFGGPMSAVLMKATTTVTSNANCQATVPNLVPSQMCTYSPPQDTCQYDSGGPLIRRFQRLFVVGVISFGRGCGSPTPFVNTRVTSYLNWIRTHVDGDSLCWKK